MQTASVLCLFFCLLYVFILWTKSHPSKTVAGGTRYIFTQSHIPLAYPSQGPILLKPPPERLGKRPEIDVTFGIDFSNSNFRSLS